ncbi:hypothetical protein Tco_0047502 [Tanacetum coccineum]
MTMSQSYPHILLVCHSVQGHLNPSFQLANNLICAGARVTLATPVSGFHKLKSLPFIHGLSFASFTDGIMRIAMHFGTHAMLMISNALDPNPFLLLLKLCPKVVTSEDEDMDIKHLKEKVSEYGVDIWMSLVAGVAIVGCPQFSDQTTNAKMVEEVWGNGVRAVLDEEMVVKRDEIKRCVDVVMGGGKRAKEIRKNTEKWRKVATESVKDGAIPLSDLRTCNMKPTWVQKSMFNASEQFLCGDVANIIPGDMSPRVPLYFQASACSLSTLHFLKFPENSFEVLKLQENSVEVLKILENKLESMMILEKKLESLKLQENQPVCW